jgi:hypothetical protein
VVCRDLNGTNRARPCDALTRSKWHQKYDKVAAEAAREELDHPCYLLRLAELELVDRKWRIVERRTRARPSVRRPCKLAGLRFPTVKSFDTSDFAAIPSLNQPLVLELARLANMSSPVTTY